MTRKDAFPPGQRKNLDEQIREMQRRLDEISGLVESDPTGLTQALPAYLDGLQNLLEALLSAEEERLLRDKVLTMDLLSDEDSYRQFDAIRQAKQEWEATVDSLPQLVCLIDAQGNVMRVNRTLERWGLGRVLTARGQNLHQLLHADCLDPACYLLLFWTQAQAGLANDQPAGIKTYDERLGRWLHIQSQPFVASRYPDVRRGDSFATVIVHEHTPEAL